MSKFERSKLSTKAQDSKKEVLFRTEKERIAMTLNTENEIASGLLIQRLTELYEKPIEATVRETVSNALDAVAVSHSGEEPIVEITTPTALNPVFEVKDNGVGMTYEDIKNVYAKYGSSTKSEDFEQIGAYGLGAKSPLAYGNEFTVTSVKDGEKSIIIVAREDFTNYIKVVDVTKTDEPSGTTVSIPVKSSDIEEFEGYIESYKNVPTDVKFVIDETAAKQDKYSLIKDDFVIHEDEDGPIHARVWVNNELAHEAIEVLELGISDNDSEYGNAKFTYVLGGWIYKNPTQSRYSYNFYEREIYLIELKPGIVSFNSSRDAIIPNERLTTLQDKVMNYIYDKKIIADIINSLEKTSKKHFLNFVANVIGKPQLVTIPQDEDEIEIAITGTDINFPRTIPAYISHSTLEAGDFSIDRAIKKLKEYDGEFHVAYKEKTMSNSKTPANSVHYKDFENNSRYQWFIEHKISDIMSMYKRGVVNGTPARHSISTILALVSEIHNQRYNEFRGKTNAKHFVVITDVNEDNYDIVRKRRKAINKLHYREAEGARDVIVLTSSMNKGQTEDVLSSLMLAESVDTIQYYTPESLDEIIKEKRKNKASKEKNTPKKVNFGASVIEARQSSFNIVENVYSRKQFDDYKPATNYVFTVIGKSTYLPSEIMQSYMIWYANKNDIDIEDVTLLYAYSNSFRRADLLTLMEYGPVYNTDSCDEDLSNVQLYKKEIRDNKVKRQWALKSSPTRSEEVLLSLIAALSRGRVNDIESNYDYAREQANEVAKQIGLPEIPSVDFRSIFKLKYIPKFSSSYGYYIRTDELEESICEQLEYLDEEYKDAFTYALLLLTDLRHVYTITDDNKLHAEEVRSSYLKALNNVEQIPKNAPKLVVEHFKSAAMLENEMLQELGKTLNKVMERIDEKTE